MVYLHLSGHCFKSSSDGLRGRSTNDFFLRTRLSKEEVYCHRLPRFCSLQIYVDPVNHNLQTLDTHRNNSITMLHSKRYNNDNTNLKLHEDNKSERTSAVLEQRPDLMAFNRQGKCMKSPSSESDVRTLLDRV